MEAHVLGTSADHGRRRLRRLRRPALVGAVALGCLALAAPPASAYRSNNSRWTDYNNVAWSGLSGGYIRSNSENHLRGTSWAMYCNRMSWKGYTKLYAPGSAATTLHDYWSASTPGNIEFSIPPGVSASGSSDSATWRTTLSGTTQTHSYSTYPIQFTTGAWFYSVNHSVSATRRVGSTTYNGPSFRRYETVC